MSKQYVVEARNADGSLNFEGTQPPFLVASEAQLLNHYLDNNPDYKATWAAMEKWFNEHGWYIRVKHW